MSNILIGTSGYDYPEWKGVFYPVGVKRAEFLSYYATQFNALELNNTFYNMPTAERLFSFYERSEGRLQFSIKANQLLTHEVTSLWQNAAEEFKTALMPLTQKDVLSAVLFQFPQSFHYTNDNRIYLAKLISAFEGFPVVIEFRHKEWIRDSVFEGLIQRKASVAFCDMPELKYLPSSSTFIGPNAYIRLHGRNADAWYTVGSQVNGSARYDYEYSEEELSKFVPIIHLASEGGRKVQVFFNNHPKGNGAKNAGQLKKLLDCFYSQKKTCYPASSENFKKSNSNNKGK